jgi:hypothetical protein
MNLDHYVDTVRSGVTTAASLADEQTQSVANRLGASIDSATRLALIEALSDAAGVISAELAPGSVELRMAGNEPQFVVSTPEPSGEPTMLRPAPDPTEPTEPFEVGEVGEDEPVARISLRLPASVKARVDELADGAGISTNAWLVRAITTAIESPRPADQPPTARRGGEFGGIFGPNGPFGPNGVFGPRGPFAEQHGREMREDLRREARAQWNSPHGVQGWVK